MMTMASTTDSVILILVCWAGLIGSFTIPMVVKAIVADPPPSDLTPRGEGDKLTAFGR
jgi:hypothetical protein